ncbi:hypothetical protein ABD87_14940 [Lysinibacillus sphaericus]|uniref:hypothetical protein n=1 Tax=Lysinibacillus sphaericus TaxID=1421 RepID=UPI0018CD797B|nr:hypothetical protein [Lysinibacillus sphaericus]MBG9730790.1 hypothetical protein [Lysinibacillus sphaericus]
MKKFAIRRNNINHDAHLIFHATPKMPNDPHDFDAYDLYEHQWYLTKDINVVGFPIIGECYEMYTTSTNLIKEKDYDGLYLYCKRIDKKSNKVNNTEFIRLYSDVNKIITSGTVFDDLSNYDEDGNITSQVKPM